MNINKNIPKISILVPVCNVEKYLAKCLDSIVAQTLRDMEIIIINDGSTDASLSIAQKYAACDARIHIIDKQNEGYGRSMNRGMVLARGEYIGIVESDDWVDPDMFERLIAIADEHKAEVVKSDFYKYTSIDGEVNQKRNLLPPADCGFVFEPRKRVGIFWAQPSIWSAIYRRDFLVKNEIRFLESPGASFQDTAFNFKVLIMARRVFLTNDAYLHYRCDNENSSVKSSGKVFCVADEWASVERYLAVRDKDLHAAAQGLIPYIKLGTYVWNLNRLSRYARRRFQVVFGLEYDAYIRGGLLSSSHFDNRFWNWLMCVVYPRSLWWRVRRIWGGIIRPIYKTRIRGGDKVWLVCGKCVKRRRIPDIVL